MKMTQTNLKSGKATAEEKAVAKDMTAKMKSGEIHGGVDLSGKKSPGKK